MSTDSKTAQKTLDKVKGFYDHTKKSVMYTSWRQNCDLWWDFYDGHQWTEDEIQELKRRSQPPIVINQIATKVDALAGTEVSQRTQIAYKPRNFSDDAKKMAKALTTAAMQIQDIDSVPMKFSDVYRSQLVAGIGWVELTFEDGRPCTEHVDEKEVLWDVDDMSQQLTKSKYVHREYWTDIDEAKQKFPGHKKELDQLVQNAAEDAKQQHHNQMTSDMTEGMFTEDSVHLKYADPKMNKVLIINTQYKKPSKKYCFYNQEGRYKEVFDKDAALKEVNESDIEEKDAFIIMDAFWTCDTLLSHVALPVQTGYFTLIPTVYKRQKRDGVFYGVVKPAVDPQQEFNKRRSKMMHLLNTQGVIADSDAFGNVRAAQEELSRPDFFLLKKRDSNVEIVRNQSLADGQFQVMNDAGLQIRNVMGIYDELQGAQTNATSGLAIQRRQTAALNNKGESFDNFSHFKKRYGEQLLAMIQSTATNKFVVRETDPETQEVLEYMLNVPYEKNGKTVFSNDISTYRMEVAIEEVPEVSSPPAELAQNLTQMIMNGQIGIVLQSPTLAKYLGIRNMDKIQQELQQSQQVSAPSPDGQTGAQGAAPPAANPPS